MRVSIGKFPGSGVRPYELPEGANVAAALQVARLDSGGFDIFINGQPADLDTILTDGKAVLLSAKIKSNKKKGRKNELSRIFAVLKRMAAHRG